VIGTSADLDVLDRDHRVKRLVRDALQEVIEFEGPIEIDRLIRLVHKRFGMDRVREGRRHLMARHIPTGIVRTEFDGTTFLWPSHQHPDSWRGFRWIRTSNDRKFAEIAPEEVANAIDEARRAGKARNNDELYRSTTSTAAAL
jgi:hypothetical protein